jgi:hypothetical protein
MERDLRARAALQGGVVTRAQARAAGYTDDAIRHRLATGRWVAVRRGAFAECARVQAASGDAYAEHALVVAAQLLISRLHAVASHTSAARLLRLPYVGGWPAVPTISAGPDASHRRRPFRNRYVDCRVSELPHTQLLTVAGLRATSPARTGVDVGRELPFAEAVVVLDAMLTRGLCSKLELEEVVEFCGGWPNVVRARRAVAFADPMSESVVESFARATLVEQGLPPARPQVWLFDDRGAMGRVDLYFDEWWTAVEIDGAVKYRDPKTLVAEKLRQERLEEAGIVVVRASFSQLRDEPRRTADRVRAAFERSLRQRAIMPATHFMARVGPAPEWYVAA